MTCQMYVVSLAVREKQRGFCFQIVSKTHVEPRNAMFTRIKLLSQHDLLCVSSALLPESAFFMIVRF